MSLFCNATLVLVLVGLDSCYDPKQEADPKVAIFYLRPLNYCYVIDLEGGEIVTEYPLEYTPDIVKYQGQQFCYRSSSLQDNRRQSIVVVFNALVNEKISSCLLGDIITYEYAVSVSTRKFYFVATDRINPSETRLVEMDLDHCRITNSMSLRMGFDSASGESRSIQFLSVSQTGKWAAFVQPWVDYEPMSFYVVNLQQSSIQEYVTEGRVLNNIVFTNSEHSVIITSEHDRTLYQLSLQNNEMRKIYDNDDADYINVIPFMSGSSFAIHFRTSESTKTEVAVFNGDGKILRQATLPFSTSTRSQMYDDSTLCLIRLPEWHNFANRGKSSLMSKFGLLDFILVDLATLTVRRTVSINVPQALAYSDRFLIMNY